MVPNNTDLSLVGRHRPGLSSSNEQTVEGGGWAGETNNIRVSDSHIICFI